VENNENTWYPQHLDRRTGKVYEDMPVNSITPDVFPLQLLDGGIVPVRNISEFNEWLEDAEGREQQKINEIKVVVDTPDGLPRLDPYDLSYDGEDGVDDMLYRAAHNMEYDEYYKRLGEGTLDVEGREDKK
jgi:hypothetical protein